MSKYFTVKTNKSPIEYMCSEEMVFDIDVCENGIPFRLDYVRWECSTDDGKFEEGVARCPFTIKTNCAKPGFAHITCKAYNENDELRTDIDILEASAGAEIEKISFADTIPDDFDVFWSEIEQKVQKHDTVILKKELCEVKQPCGFENYLCYDITISTPISTPVTGYITYPKTDKPLPIKMMFMGYSLMTPEPQYNKDFITFIVGAHGFENGKSKFEQSNAHSSYNNYGFNEKENSDPKTAYWHGMMIRDLCAVKFAKSLPMWDGKNLISSGGSQGALQATTVAAHEQAVSFLDITIPWFCNLNSVNKGYMNGWFPKYADGLRYYDTAFQGTRVKCPVRIVAYLGDCICPPHTISALYNGIKTEKELVFIQAGTHSYRPPQKNCYSVNNIDERTYGQVYDYKGKEYEVLYIATDSETSEKIVVYRDVESETVYSIPKYRFNEYILYNGEYKKHFAVSKTNYYIIEEG